MRRFVLVLAALGALCAVSCGSAKLVPFADFEYRISCREGAATGHGCVPQVRVIQSSDGMNGVRVHSCSISRSGAMPALSFDVSGVDPAGESFGIAVSGAYYDSTGAILGSSCTLTATEGGNQYVGRCGSVTPATDQPCRITGIKESFDNPADMNPQIEGDIVCAHLPNQAAPVEVREVESTSVATGQPFHFRIVFCDGVMPPTV